MAKLTNKGRRGLGFPSRARHGETVHAFVLQAGDSATVPDWYINELNGLKGMRVRAERGELAIAEGDDGGDDDEERDTPPPPTRPASPPRAPVTPPSGPPSGRPATLEGIPIPGAGPLIADETDLDVLERWKADERVTIQRLVADRISELTTPIE